MSSIIRTVLRAGLVFGALSSPAWAGTGVAASDGWTSYLEARITTVDAVASSDALLSRAARTDDVALAAVAAHQSWMTSGWTWPGAIEEGRVPAWYGMYAGPWDASLADYALPEMGSVVDAAVSKMSSVDMGEAAADELDMVAGAYGAVQSDLLSAAKFLQSNIENDRTYQIAVSAGLLHVQDGVAVVDETRMDERACAGVANVETPTGTACVSTLAHLDENTRDYLRFLAWGTEIASSLRLAGVEAGDAEAQLKVAARARRVEAAYLALKAE